MEERKGRRTAGGKTGDSRGKTQNDLLRGALNWVLHDKIFADLRMHGNTKWLPKYLVALAVLTAWCDGSRLTDAFDKAKKLSENLYGLR